MSDKYNNTDESIEDVKEPTQEDKEQVEEELDQLLKAIEEIERQNKDGKKQKRGFLAIEFGGVFHRNPILNFLFSLLLNFTLSYLLIELFNLATYQSILYLVYFTFGFTIFESIYRQYIMKNHFTLILKSFGSIFYFGYIIIVFILDRYILQSYFVFTEGILLMVYITFFTIVRYFVSVYMKRRLRGF